MNMTCRWFKRGDVDELCEMENNLGEKGINKEQILKAWRRKDVVVKVVYTDEKLVGYVIYTIVPHSLCLIRMVVRKELENKGIGEVLLREMKMKLNGKRREIQVLIGKRGVRETKWWDKNGFERGNDEGVMSYELPMWGKENRIIEYLTHPEQFHSEKN